MSCWPRSLTTLFVSVWPRFLFISFFFFCKPFHVADQDSLPFLLNGIYRINAICFKDVSMFNSSAAFSLPLFIIYLFS